MDAKGLGGGLMGRKQIKSFLKAVSKLEVVLENDY